MKVAKGFVAVALVAAVVAVFSGGGAEAGSSAPRFLTLKLDGADSGTEPRVTVGPNNWRWLETNKGGDAVVYVSKDKGRSWALTKTEPAGQTSPTIDVDIVSTPSKRKIASELDFGGINFRVSYTDDGGKTWTQSTGAELGDTDRQWLAVGPAPAESKQYPVYLLFHNLASGTANHDMYVQTSTDSGATFGPPIPITGPEDGPDGARAFADLQCSDSGGPSDLFVNQKTGEIYAVWGTRSSAVGGCGAQPLEANIVGATEIWVATSTDGGTTWTDHLAVDDSQSGKLVGMQLAPGALDNKGNIYVFYPESPNPYPNYDGAAMKYVWSKGTADHWSKPVTVNPTGGAGNVLPHIIVGDPGKIDFAYFHGVEQGTGKKPAWFTTVSQTLNGLSASPRFTTRQVSKVPTYTGTASELMGACTSGNPASGVENGFTCNRSTDVWGIALDKACLMTITWPTVSNEAPGADPGTFVSTQTGGKPVC